MNLTLFCSLILFFYIVYALAAAIHGERNPLRKAFSSMLSGALVLLAIHVTSPFTGHDITISTMSLSVSLIGGVWGVALLMALNAYF